MSLFSASRLSVGLVSVRRSLPRSALLTRYFCSTETESTGEHGFYHVTIAGGGMVGTAMACALGSHPMFEGKNILLLEAGPSKTYSDSVPDHYSNRVSSLNPGSVELLKSIGAWQYLTKMRVKPYKKLQVWDSCSDAMITFDRDNFSKEMAHIVENDLTINALSKIIDSLKGDRVETRYGSRVKTIELPKRGDNARYPFVKVHLENGDEVQTQLLIGADGANSSLRRMTNINHMSWSYDQSAVVGTLQLAEPIENNVAWQRFLPTGPIAMLPLSDTESSLVWTTSNQDAKKLVDLPEDQFVDAVNNAFWHESEKHPLVDTAGRIMGNVLSTLMPSTGGSSVRQLPPSIIGIDENSRAMFPLGLGHSTQYVKPRLVLIGDAAHRVHPLAGLGVNLGFADVASLRDILVQAVQNAEDLGALPHLLEYETERQKHVVPIMATVDGLKRLFSTDAAPAVLLRSLGLQATNALKPVKDLFVQGASR